jgi:hypothetical protein
MNEGDIVRIKPQFHRPTRIGQFARIVRSRSVGVEERNMAIQHWIIYKRDGLSDWVNEYDLELVEESHEFDDVINTLQYEGETGKTVLLDVPFTVNELISEVNGKKVLNL